MIPAAPPDHEHLHLRERARGQEFQRASHFHFKWLCTQQLYLKRPSRFVCAFLLLQFSILGLSLLSLSQFSLASKYAVAPDTRYTPEEVVKIIVKSLQFNDSDNDEGIATVFRFASPENRAVTGPLARFTRMIKQGYPEMINHIGAHYSPMEVTGDAAVQAVWLRKATGEEIGYAFKLRRQADGKYDGMWMTESVLPLGQSPRSGIRI